MVLDADKGSSIQLFLSKRPAQHVGDKYHMQFECSAVQHNRSRYQHLFTGASQTIQEILWQVAIKSNVLHA